MAEEDPLHGWQRRDVYMRRLGKSDWTGKRWQRLGLLVVQYWGRTPMVDAVATAALRREEHDRLRRKRP